MKPTFLLLLTIITFSDFLKPKISYFKGLRHTVLHHVIFIAENDEHTLQVTDFQHQRLWWQHAAFGGVTFCACH